MTGKTKKPDGKFNKSGNINKEGLYRMRLGAETIEEEWGDVTTKPETRFGNKTIKTVLLFAGINLCKSCARI